MQISKASVWAMALVMGLGSVQERAYKVACTSWRV